MSYEMKLEQGLSQQLNQFQVQSLKILSFDNYELEKFLQDEYAENPLMEHKESGKEFFTLHGNAGGYQDIEQSDIEDKKIEDSEAFFMEQLNAKDYTKKEWNVMKYMAQCLEESGLLLVSTKEISHKLGIEEKDCERLLDHLKQLEPAGVFAESVSECLLLQLEREGILNDDLRYIVENHLEDIAMGHLSTVSRALDIKTSQVRKYIFKIQELNPGSAIIIKKNGKVSIEEVRTPLVKKACSFERIYFSRGSDAEIYRERKELGKLIFPSILKAIDNDTDNTVFSYIPNTAETSFYGMSEAAQDFLNQRKAKAIIEQKDTLTEDTLKELLSVKIRTEKIAIKDAKLRRINRYLNNL